MGNYIIKNQTGITPHSREMTYSRYSAILFLDVEITIKDLDGVCKFVILFRSTRSR